MASVISLLPEQRSYSISSLVALRRFQPVQTIDGEDVNLSDYLIAGQAVAIATGETSEFEVEIDGSGFWLGLTQEQIAGLGDAFQYWFTATEGGQANQILLLAGEMYPKP